MTANPNGATLRELRTLNDLDLGALAYNTRIAGEPLTPADLDVICAAYTANPDGYRAVLTATRGHKFVFAQGARELAALGAKVRAALPQEPNPLQARLDALQRRIDADALRWGPSNLAIADVEGARQALAELRDGPASTAPLADQIRALPRPAAPTKPVPRVLQSADEAPRGSLLRRSTTQTLTLRLWNGCGWNLEGGGRLSDWNGWQWDISKDEPCTLIAEGLTEDECRHMSGLSAADALAWCEKRQAALHVPTTCDKATTYWLQVAKERAESTAATKGGVLEATRTALRTEPDACIIRTAEQVRALADEALQVRAGAADKARGDVAAREEIKAVVPAPAAPGKPRPQPGDVVPWAEVEDGALYQEEGEPGFRMVTARGCGFMKGPDDIDIVNCLAGAYDGTKRERLAAFHSEPGILVARDLGTDPEAWRQAMRDWTANGNKPAAPNEDGCNLSYDEQRKRANDWRDEATIAIKRYKTAEAALKTAVELVEQVTKERDEHAATAARRLETLHEADERDIKVREALGDVDFESTEGAVLRIMKQHELDLKAAAFEIKHLRDERDEARARVDSLRRHNDPDRPPAP